MTLLKVTVKFIEMKLNDFFYEYKYAREAILYLATVTISMKIIFFDLEVGCKT